MTANQRALPTNPWIVVLLCFAALSITASARQSVAIMTDDWVQTLGWSKTFIGSGQSVAFIVIALVSPISGGLVDRYDVRILLTGGLSLVAFGLLAFAAFPSPTLYVIGYGLISGIGIAAASMHVMSAAIARLIEDRRGLAIGIADSGSTVGQVITVPLLTMALAWFSWRWGLSSMGLACLLMAILIWVVLKPAKPIHKQSHAAADNAESVGAQLKALLLSPVFHILFWSFFICGVTTTGAIETHFLPYAAFCGFPPVPASGVYGLTMALNFAGMMGAGYLADKMNRPLLLGLIYLGRSLSFIVLLNVGTSYEMMTLFAIIFGIFDYSTVPVTASLVASHLGLRSMGLSMGLISGGHSLGGALGAFLGGYLFDMFLRYSEMWWTAFGLAVLAGLMCFFIRERRPSALAPGMVAAG
jgi:MFS family permease